jgi:hypothetical protein
MTHKKNSIEHRTTTTTTQRSWHILPKFRNTCRDENLVDDLPSATHTRIPFQAYVPSAGGQKEGSWRGEGGGKVTDIAETSMVMSVVKQHENIFPNTVQHRTEIWYIFVNCNWVVTRWQKYSTHLHTKITQNDTKQTIHTTTQLLEECGPCPVLASYTLAVALKPRKKHGKTSVRVAASKNT